MELWEGFPPTWRTELLSAFHTFVATFVGTILFSLQVTGEVSWTKEALVALLIAAIRAGFKAVSVYILSRVLPDPKN